MTVSVPTSDQKNTQKAAQVTALATQVAAQPTSGGPAAALAQAQLQAAHELVVALMSSGKLNPLTILSTCTYGT
jgi:hypothetical protein